MKKMTEKSYKWSKRVFAVILSLAMIATSFSGDIENLVWATEGEPVVEQTEQKVDDPGTTGTNESSSDEQEPSENPENEDLQDEGSENEGSEDEDPDENPAEPETPEDPAASSASNVTNENLGGDSADDDPAANDEDSAIDPAALEIFNMSKADFAAWFETYGVDGFMAWFFSLPVDYQDEWIYQNGYTDDELALFMGYGGSGDESAQGEMPMVAALAESRAASPSRGIGTGENNLGRIAGPTTDGEFYNIKKVAFEVSADLLKNDAPGIMKYEVRAIATDGTQEFVSDAVEVSLDGVGSGYGSVVIKTGTEIVLPKGVGCEIYLVVEKLYNITDASVGPYVVSEANWYDGGLFYYEKTTGDTDGREYDVIINNPSLKFGMCRTGSDGSYTVDGTTDPQNVGASTSIGNISGMRYESDNTEVAIVDGEGTVTPVGPGTTTIRAYTDVTHSATAHVSVISYDRDKETVVWDSGYPTITMVPAIGDSNTEKFEDISKWTVTPSGTTKGDPGTYTRIYTEDGLTFEVQFSIEKVDMSGIAATAQVAEGEWTGKVTATAGGKGRTLTDGTDFTVVDKTIKSISGDFKTVTYDLTLEGAGAHYEGEFFAKNVPMGVKKDEETIDIGEVLSLDFPDLDIQYTGYGIYPGGGEDPDSHTTGQYDTPEYMKVMYDDKQLFIKKFGGVYYVYPSDSKTDVGDRIARVYYGDGSGLGYNGDIGFVPVRLEGYADNGYTGTVEGEFVIGQRRINELSLIKGGGFDVGLHVVGVDDKAIYEGGNFEFSNVEVYMVTADKQVKSLYTGVANPDYTVTYINNGRVGTATMMIIGSGDKYTGSVQHTFNIISKLGDASFCFVNSKKVEFPASPGDSSAYSLTYTGEQLKPTVRVRVNNKPLIVNTDYVLSYGENKNVGIGSVTVSGKPGSDYDGMTPVTLNFEITQADLPNNVVLSVDRTFDGGVLPLPVKGTELKLLDANSKEIPLGEYEIVSAVDSLGRSILNGSIPTISGDIEIGINATGEGNYRKLATDIKKTYTVEKADLSADPAPVFFPAGDVPTIKKSYTGSPIDITRSDFAKITYKGHELDLSRVAFGCSNNKEIGTATAVFTGQDFTGSYEYTYQIVAKTLLDDGVKIYMLPYNYEIPANIPSKYLLHYDTVNGKSGLYPSSSNDYKYEFNGGSFNVTPRLYVVDGNTVLGSGSYGYEKAEKDSEGNEPTKVCLGENKSYCKLYGRGVYNGTEDMYVYYTISPVTITKSMLTVPVDYRPDNMSGLTVKKTYTYAQSTEEKTLERGNDSSAPPVKGDYYVVNDASTKPGEHTARLYGSVEIDGIGNYTTGAEGLSFTYTLGENLAGQRFYIDGKQVTLGSVLEIPYTGEEPVVTVKKAGSEDYIGESEYSCEGPGTTDFGPGTTGTFTIDTKGVNYYCGSPIKLQYKVTMASLKDLMAAKRLYLLDNGEHILFDNKNITFGYDGKSHAIMGCLEMKVGEKYIHLNHGTDYTFERVSSLGGVGEDNYVRDVGDSITYKIKGKGNYSNADADDINGTMEVAKAVVNKIEFTLPYQGQDVKYIYQFDGVGSPWKWDKEPKATYAVGGNTKGKIALYSGDKEVNSGNYTIGDYSYDTPEYGKKARVTVTVNGNYTYEGGGDAKELEFDIKGRTGLLLNMPSNIVEYSYDDSSGEVNTNLRYSVLDGSKVLAKGTDYVEKLHKDQGCLYELANGREDLLPGKYYLHIEGQNEYGGSSPDGDPKEFTVKCDIANNPAIEITCDPLEIDSSGEIENKLNAVKISLAGKAEKLVSGTDYEITWPNSVQPGPGNKIKIVGKGDYFYGAVSLDAAGKINLASCTIKVNGTAGYVGLTDAFDYTGGNIGLKPYVTITWPGGGSGGTIINPAYYTITETGYEVGERTATVEIADAYKEYFEGTLSRTFTYHIVYNLAGANVLVGANPYPDTYTYPAAAAAETDAGSAAVYVGDKLLTRGTDYSVGSAVIAADNKSGYIVLSSLKDASGKNTGDAYGEKTLRFKVASVDLTQQACQVLFYNDSSGNYDLTNFETTFNGNAQSRLFKLRVNGEILNEKYYNYNWVNNVKANVDKDENRTISDPQLVIQGTGGYTGTINVQTTIKPLHISDANCQLVVSPVSYTGAPIETGDLGSHKLTCTTLNRLLSSPDDYTVEVTGTSVTAVGATGGKVRATGHGDYYGTVEADLEVVPKELQDEDISLGSTKRYYTGYLENINLKVLEGSKELIYNSDYTVEISGGISAASYQVDSSVCKIKDKGKYEIVVKGKGNYTGTVKKAYEVLGRRLDSIYNSAPLIKIIMTAKGSEFKNTETDPKLVAQYDGEGVSDYVAGYIAKNLSYTSMSDYNSNRPLFDLKDSYSDSTVVSEKTLTVKSDDPLAPIADYEIIETNVNFGDGTVMGDDSPYVLIQGINNYEGAVKIYFSVGASLYEPGMVSVSVQPYRELTYDGTEKTPDKLSKITVTYGIGSSAYTLKSDEYKVEKIEDMDYVNAGVKSFKIVGQKTFYGTIDGRDYYKEDKNGNVYYDDSLIAAWYRVIPKKVTNYEKKGTIRIIPPSDIKVDSDGVYCAEYTGSDIVPAIEVRDGSRTLVEGVDYDLDIQGDNRNVTTGGNAKLWIKWKGNYEWIDGSEEYKELKIVPIAAESNFSITWMTTAGNVVDYNNSNEPDMGDLYKVRLIKDGTQDTYLNEGTDYEVNYYDYATGQYYKDSSGDINPDFKFTAGRKKLIIKGKDNYSGTVEDDFYICAKLSDATNEKYDAPFYNPNRVPVLSNLSFTCGGNDIVLDDLKLTSSGVNKVVYENDEFKVSYSGISNGDGANVRGEVYVESKTKAYTSVFQRTYNTQTNLDAVGLSYNHMPEYTGEPVDIGYRLTLGDDEDVTDMVAATIRYYDGEGEALSPVSVAPVNKGDYFFEIDIKMAGTTRNIENGEGTGNYKFPFTVVPRTLVNDGITVEYQDEWLYTGSEIEPSVTVRDGGTLLERGVDYVVGYAENIYPVSRDAEPRAEIRLSGIGEYGDTEVRVEKFAIRLGAPEIRSITAYSSESFIVNWINPQANGLRLVCHEVKKDGTTVQVGDEVSMEGTFARNTYYRFEGLKGDTAYEVELWSLVDSADGSGRIESEHAFSGTVRLPAVQTGNVTAAQNGTANAVTLSWTKKSGVNAYEIIRSSSKDTRFILIASLPVRLFSSTDVCSWGNSGLEKGVTYYYIVRPKYLNEDGQITYGGNSPVVAVKIQ